MLKPLTIVYQACYPNQCRSFINHKELTFYDSRFLLSRVLTSLLPVSLLPPLAPSASTRARTHTHHTCIYAPSHTEWPLCLRGQLCRPQTLPLGLICGSCCCKCQKSGRPGCITTECWRFEAPRDMPLHKVAWTAGRWAGGLCQCLA